MQTNQSPTRRTAIGFSLAAMAAGLTVPALASAAKPDAELIALCNRMVAIETELCLLSEHDEYAPDFGPNHARHGEILDEREKLMELIGDSPAPTGPAGIAAMARAALTWVERNSDGD